MDFNQVRYFLALADTLNFTRAAERCYVSQPALTQAIKRMETELGGKLVRRDGRYTELTEMGKSLRGYFEQIDNARHKLRETAKAVTSGEVAELNIGIMCTLGPQVLAPLLDAFQAQHPMVTLVLHDVVQDSIADLLLSGALDGAFCARHKMPHPAIRYFPLFEESMVVTFAADHPFARLKSVPLRKIADQRYVDRLHCEFRQEFLEYCSREGLDLEVAFRSQREDWVQSMVRDGAGVSVIPRFSVLADGLQYRRISEPDLVRMVEFAAADLQETKPALDLLLQQLESYDWRAIMADGKTVSGEK